jgi:hypothetical protein
VVETGTKVVLRDVDLIFRNFSGEPGKFNKEGQRNFGVLLDPPMAEAMAEDGWNVKWLKPREDAEDDEEQQAWLPVEIRFDIRPPRVYQVTSRGRTMVGEDVIGTFDGDDIAKTDLIIRAWNWSNEGSGKSGVKAFVHSLYVTIEEDELEREYAELDQQ